METREKAVVVLSGGMDSTALAYLLHNSNDIIAVSFNYGQRHAKELQFAAITAGLLNAEHKVINMSFMADLLHGSALTSNGGDVPEGHYADDNMKATVVPNRNMIMLSIAVGIAVAEGANFVATGVHAGDHPVYPDCRPEFIEYLSQTAVQATLGFAPVNFQVIAPFVNIGKDEIVKIGQSDHVPWVNTWSCYKGGEIHCGKCGTCVERKEAFRLAEVFDPTEYEDPDFEVQAFKY